MEVKPDFIRNTIDFQGQEGEVEKMDRQKAIELLKQKSEEAVHVASLPYYNNGHITWRRNIEDILEATFGVTSTEYKRVAAVQSKTIKGTRVELQRAYVRIVHRIQQEVNSIIQKYEILELEAKPLSISEPKDIAELPIHLFDKMQFHTQVVRVSRELFKDGHYRDAIYRAFVEVNNFVKLRAKSRLDGKKLMSTVFSPDNPIIKLNPLETQTDKDEQEGFMFLFMGAIQGIRNPKAHENIIQNNPYIALKLIGFASLLMETISFWEARET